MGDMALEDLCGKDCAFVTNWLQGKGLKKFCAIIEYWMQALDMCLQ